MKSGKVNLNKLTEISSIGQLSSQNSEDGFS
jgi:hypothetical protein